MNVSSDDPYEMKLYQMFQSVDTDSCGLLNEEALRRLCCLLELHDRGDMLIAGLNLSADGMKSRVSFDSFKQALLNFLGTELDGNVGPSSIDSTDRVVERTLVIRDEGETYIENPSVLSDREVSPKFVVGSKKYGRRSRPQAFDCNELSVSPSDSENGDDTEGESSKKLSSTLVQRSSSQTDIPSSRQQRPNGLNGKLKRCASLPAQKNLQRKPRSTIIGKGKGTANNKSSQTAQDEQKLTHGSSAESLGCQGSSVSVFSFSHNSGELSSKRAKDVTAISDTITAVSLLDIWERANIGNGRSLLLALGFDDENINIVQLNKVLEEEIRGVEEDPQTTLLRAALALQTSEVSTIRQTFRQLQAENRKLRNDYKEANQRAALLAIEIDERHAAMEESTKKEIRNLEQRHANLVRDLTTRMANDRENWSNLCARLESRIKTFEQEEIKLKTEVDLVRNENTELEGEMHKLQKQITELLEKNIKLNQQITDLEDRPREQITTSTEAKLNDGQVDQLLEKISLLQLENTSLRDKNDELVSEMENVNIELQRLKTRHKKQQQSATIVVEVSESEETEQTAGGLTATKRRGDSPSKVRCTEESPRLGKLRKCSNEDSGPASDVSDASGDWLALNSELKNSTLASEETAKLRQQISALEEELKQLRESNNNKESAEERCKELENSLEQMQKAYEDCEDYWQTKLAEERQMFEKERQIFEEEQKESDSKFTELMEKVREYEDQFSKDGRLSPIEEKDTLEQQFAELEAEVEEVRENARRIFEEKSQEIEKLQAEVEDLRLRLGESVEILTGASELNEEATKRRSHVQSPASSPISYLWHQSTIQEPAKVYDAISQSTVTMSSPSKRINRNNLSTSETTIFSTPPPETSPSSPTTISPIQKPGGCKSSFHSDAGDAADCDTSSTTSSRSFETHSVASVSSANVARTQLAKSGVANSQTNTGAEISCSSPSGIKEELKRLKFFEISLREQIKDLSLQRDGLVMELQQLQEARPVLEKAYARTAHPSLIQRVNQLELRNRHLQNVIKQQQQYTEGLMQQSWRQHQMDVTELHNRIESQGSMLAEQAQRLQNADILVKDLYVENSHLTATVQRLEQQRARVNLMHQQRQGLAGGIPGLPGMP